jgi:hypothetical protein
VRPFQEEKTMTKLAGKWSMTAALVTAVLATFGCAAAGRTIDDVFSNDPRSSTLHGEVVAVDTRFGRLEIREDRGRSYTVRYDDRTRVVGGSRSYSVRDLRRGDVVAVRVVQDRSGEAWADRIELRDTVASRDGRSGRVTEISGSVSWLDTRNGSFGMSLGLFRPSATIYTSRNTSRSDRNRAERLRRGDRVRVEVREIGRNEYELVRFR